MRSVNADPWYRNAVIYGLDVETYDDSTGDGIGDFHGLIERLDYLKRLGISALWLLPFYPTPNRDNGYDVTDYYGVDPRLGDLGDFVEFIDEADDRGIRVLIDLVVNHTSDQHPWFQAARRDPESDYRDYYVWVEDPPPPRPDRASVFPGEVEGDRVWSYDSEASAYYYHRFYPFQPDLNTANPAVREEIKKIMKFWLRLGVDGFRVDAATLLIQPKQPDAEEPADPHELLRSLKRQVLAQRGDGILLAEADDEPHRLQEYVGTDQVDLLMNFILNAHLVAGLAVEEAEPIIEGIERIPVLEGGSYTNFLRNYDELNIGRLPTELKEKVFDIFAPDPQMRIYGRGIRRRIAPLLGGDNRRLRMAYSLMFSMPGTPLLLYGNEIGMGDDPARPGREPVRTPMQWSDDRNAGFSTAPASDLVAPLIDDEDFGYHRVNVAAQRADADSLLNWMHMLIATRQECHEIGHGELELMPAVQPSVLGHRYPGEDRTLFCAHNLANDRVSVSWRPSEWAPGSLHPLIGDATALEVEDGAISGTLEPYGFVWTEVTNG